jgi:hypothetical protein
MPDSLVLPALAILLPGLAAYVLGRVARSVWPGIILACLALGWGGRLMYQASGAAHDDGAAVIQVLAAFALAAPAALSALVGMAFAWMRKSKAA